MSEEAWNSDSRRWRGRILTGDHGHWCPDYDYLPIDETCPEWPCACGVGKEAMRRARWRVVWDVLRYCRDMLLLLAFTVALCGGAIMLFLFSLDWNPPWPT